MNITCDVSDNVAIDSVNIRIFYLDGIIINDEMTKILGIDCFYYNSTLSVYGNYSYKIFVKDNSGNTKYLDSLFFSFLPIGILIMIVGVMFWI